VRRAWRVTRALDVTLADVLEEMRGAAAPIDSHRVAGCASRGFSHASRSLVMQLAALVITAFVVLWLLAKWWSEARARRDAAAAAAMAAAATPDRGMSDPWLKPGSICCCTRPRRSRPR
jgi:hypothetical protein